MDIAGRSGRTVIEIAAEVIAADHVINVPAGVSVELPYIAAALDKLKPVNREEWLSQVAEKFRDRFEALNWPLPPASKLAFAVGFPSKNARSNKKRRLGECWDPRTTPDGTIHILISPVIGDAIEAAGILVHELVHAAVGTNHGHDKTFQKVAKDLGLEGKPTETTVGEQLREELEDIIASVGPYPHQPLSFVAGEKKKSANRQKKVTCPEHAAFIARMSRKTYQELGAPLCALCSSSMEMEDEGEEADDE